MYPLLAAAGSTIATNLLDSVSSLVQRKLAQSQQAAKGQTTQAPPAPQRVPTLQEQIASVRSQLMSAPEVQTMVNSTSSNTANSLSVSPGGSVTYTAPDGRTSALSLSPATAQLAQELGGLLSQANGAATSGTFSLMAPARPTLSVYA